jgi:ParB family transcriptional regulator, chromosome partitioning protein
MEVTMAETPSSAKKRPPRLGRGLSSLMAQPVSIQPPPAAPGSGPADGPPAAASAKRIQAPRVAFQSQSEADGDHGDGLRYLPVDAISPSRFQPRQHFEPAALEALAASIKAEGMMQPLIVRPLPADDGQPRRYELIAGERRWRAARQIQLETVPALVREIEDARAAQWALIENLQREDLNPIERATAFQRLIDRFAMSHEQVAQQVGIQRSTVSNLLRLLDLHDDVQDLIRRGLLSSGHAKPLAGLSDVEMQKVLGRKIVAGGWSVRRVEQEVARLTDGGEPAGGSQVKAHVRQRRSAVLADLEQQIAAQLDTRVQIRAGRRKGSGTLCIDFYSLDQFDQLMQRLGVNTE